MPIQQTLPLAGTTFEQYPSGLSITRTSKKDLAAANKLLEQAEEKALGFLGSSTERALSELDSSQLVPGQEQLNQYAQGGASAFDRALAFMGIGPNAMSPDQIAEAYNATPGQQFLQEQGMRGVQNKASAGGYRGSGALLKDLIRFNQGLASTQFNTNQDQLRGLAGLGANASAQLANIGTGIQQQRAGLLGSLGANQANIAFGSGQQRQSALAQGATRATSEFGYRPVRSGAVFGMGGS